MVHHSIPNPDSRFISADLPFQNEDTLVTVEEKPVSKVVLNELADFKFTAAYQAYSKSFDNADGAEERRMLNNIISQLFNKEISYPHFYREINQHLGGSGRSREFARTRIKGQRKRAYRRDQQEKERIKRHRR